MVRIHGESKLRPRAVRVPVPSESGSWTVTGGARPCACPYVLSWSGFLVPAATENLPCLYRHPLKSVPDPIIIFRYLSIIPLGELTVTRFQLRYTLHRHEHETVLY